MQETKRNVLVGIFMVTGLGVLGTLMVVFGEQPSWLGGAEYELRIEFTELKDVNQGMPIFLNGVQVGRVGRLEFRNPQRPDQGVDVVGLIKDRYSIPTDAEALVQPGLLGLARGKIEIVPPGIETEPLPRGASIQGKMGSAFGDLIPDTMVTSLDRTTLQVGNLAEAATPLATDLHHLFELRTTGQVDDPLAQAQGVVANVYTVVQRFDTSLKHFNDVLGDPQFKESVRLAVANFEQMTADGKETFATLRRTSAQVEKDLSRIAERLDTGLANADAGINEVRGRLIPALDALAELMANLNRVSHDLAEGEGSAGMFLRDARLYEALLLSVQRITDAVDTVRRIAERFEEQGYIEFDAHKAVGPLTVHGKREIPPAGK